jgi:hypothetical protein
MRRFKALLNLKACACLFVYSTVMAIVPPQEFPLKDYVPVDFFRQDFSVSPMFSLSSSNRMVESKTGGSENADLNGDGKINLHHDYLSYSQAHEFSGTSEVELHGSPSSSANKPIYKSNSYSWGDMSQENTRLSLTAFSNHVGKWYLTEKFSLGARIEPKVIIEPKNRNSSDGRSFRIDEPANVDSVSFYINQDNSQSESRFFELRGAVSVGYGRIHNVTFAARILFLLDRIHERTGKAVLLNLAEMVQLETFVESRRRGRPFYDSRLADIFDVESIDIFLRKKVGVEYFSAGVILEMADEWHYAHWQERLSGWEIKFSPYFQTQFQDASYSSNSETYFKRVPVDQLDTKKEFLALTKDTLGRFSTNHFTRDYFKGDAIAGLMANISYNLPYHRFYQANGSLTSRFEKRRVETGATISQIREPLLINDLIRWDLPNHLAFEYPVADLGLNLVCYFFPSSRTSMSLTENTSYQVKFDYTGNKQELTANMGRVPYQDSRILKSSLELKVDYFLGHRLRLDVFGGYFYTNSHIQDTKPDEIDWYSVQDNGIQKDHSHDYRIGSGLKYYLF